MTDETVSILAADLAVLRVNRAALDFAEALDRLAVALEGLPQPAGATDAEHEDFRMRVRAFRLDVTTILEGLGADVRRHARKGQS